MFACAAGPPGPRQSAAFPAVKAQSLDSAPAAEAGGAGAVESGKPAPPLQLPWGPALLSDEERLRGQSFYGSGARLRKLGEKLLAGQPIQVRAAVAGWLVGGPKTGSVAGCQHTRCHCPLPAGLPARRQHHRGQRGADHRRLLRLALLQLPECHLPAQVRSVLAGAAAAPACPGGSCAGKAVRQPACSTCSWATCTPAGCPACLSRSSHVLENRGTPASSSALAAPCAAELAAPVRGLVLLRQLRWFIAGLPLLPVQPPLLHCYAAYPAPRACAALRVGRRPGGG